MSNQAITWALNQQFITNPTQRHVLLCIANYINKDDLTAFPSIKKLCLNTGFKERTVRYVISKLKKIKLIEEVKSTENLYYKKIPLHLRPKIYKINSSFFDINLKNIEDQKSSPALNEERFTTVDEPLNNHNISSSLKPLTLKDEIEKNNFINKIISEEHKNFCKTKNINLQSQALMFIEHHQAKGSMFSDWSSALMLWLRRAKDQFGIENSNATGEDDKENEGLQRIFNEKYPDQTYFRAVKTNREYIKKEGKYLVSQNEENRYSVLMGHEAMRAIEANKIVLVENKSNNEFIDNNCFDSHPTSINEDKYVFDRSVELGKP